MNAPSSRLLPVLLVVLVLLAMAARLWGLDGRLLGPDEWRETDTASIARNFLAAPDLFHPQVQWGAPGPGYVESELQVYPFAVAALYRGFGHDPWLGRLWSVLAFGAGAIVLYRIGRRLLPPWAALVAVLAFASAGLVFRFSRAFMPDATALLCYLLAAECFLGHRQSGRLRDLAVAGAWLALAILIKPTMVHLGLWCGLVALLQRGPRAALGPPMLAFGALALLPAALWFAHAAHLHATWGNTFGVISGGDSKWGNWSIWLDPGFYQALLRMDAANILGYGGSLLAVPGLLFWRGPLFRVAVPAWILVLFVYYLIVARYAGHEGRGLHYHLAAAPPLCLCVGAGAVVLRDWLGRLTGRTWPGIVLVAGLLGLLVFQQWRGNLRLLRAEPVTVFRDAGLQLAALSQPEDLVLVTSTDVALDHGTPNNFEEPKVLFHAWRRGRVLAADRLGRDALAAGRGIGARWVVVIEAALHSAAPDFEPALAELPLAAQGLGYRIYRVP